VNYRHAFHAGNHADVLKHIALLLCLDALRRKPAAFFVLDTHAGRARYDLESEHAARSPEFKSGIGRLWGQTGAPAPITAYLEAIASFNPDGALTTYPGSPALIAAALREGDEAHACDLHPEEVAALRQALGRRTGVRVHARDGYEAMGALLPPPQKRGLVLVDPPYEQTDELEQAVFALKGALKRFAHGVFLWWRPLKSESALARVDAELAAAGARAMVRADLWIDAPRPDGRLVGSSILAINPPFGLETGLRAALPVLADWLAAGASGWRLHS
jgi:23S rRNA (adenine2030-N6)-methyltransferase